MNEEPIWPDILVFLMLVLVWVGIVMALTALLPVVLAAMAAAFQRFTFYGGM